MNGQELEELRDRLQDVNVEVFRALRSQQEEIAELKLRLDRVPALVETLRALVALIEDHHLDASVGDDVFPVIVNARAALAEWEKP